MVVDSGHKIVDRCGIVCIQIAFGDLLRYDKDRGGHVFCDGGNELGLLLLT